MRLHLSCADAWTSPIFIRGVRIVGHVFRQHFPFPSGIVTPRNKLFLGPSPLIIPKGISIGSAVFVLVPNTMLCMHYQWKNPQNCPFPLGFRHAAGGGPSHSHRQVRQQAHKNLVKIVRVVPKISSRRQTDTHTHTCSSQYFATAPTSEVMNRKNLSQVWSPPTTSGLETERAYSGRSR